MNMSERWDALWRSIKASLSPEPIFQNLIQAYAQPQRTYHTLDHVQDCLEQLDWSCSLTEHADEVELGLWFHDVVHDACASDNEMQSTAWATTVLQNGGVAPDVTARVGQLILATRHQSLATSGDAALIMDIDLSILGRDPVAFDHYESKIRREYQEVSEAAYREGRALILESFLLRETVFRRPKFRERYEAQARDNLSRSILKLRDGLITTTF
jgi:predicted metal-dependent HD superfamily phosphohydrolase